MPDCLSSVQYLATWICNQISLTLSSSEWSWGTLRRWCCRKSFQNRDWGVLFHCWTILIGVNLSVNMWRAWANSVCKLISQICLAITWKSRELIKQVGVLPPFPLLFFLLFSFCTSGYIRKAQAIENIMSKEIEESSILNDAWKLIRQMR